MDVLKVFTSYYIDLQESLSNDDKIQLLNYVKEADEGQIKHLLLYGTMVESLTETERSYIGVAFEASSLSTVILGGGDAPDVVYRVSDFKDRSPQQIMSFVDKLISDAMAIARSRASSHGYSVGHKGGEAAGRLAGLGHAAIIALILTAGYMIYKNYLSKAAKACKGKKGVEKKSCMVTFKRDGMRARIAFLNKSKSNCKKTKVPTLCVGKIDKKIRKVKAKLGEL